MVIVLTLYSMSSGTALYSSGGKLRKPLGSELLVSRAN